MLLEKNLSLLDALCHWWVLFTTISTCSECKIPNIPFLRRDVLCFTLQFTFLFHIALAQLKQTDRKKQTSYSTVLIILDSQLLTLYAILLWKSVFVLCTVYINLVYDSIMSVLKLNALQHWHWSRFLSCCSVVLNHQGWYRSGWYLVLGCRPKIYI